jgi:hypothetical protein
MSYDDWKTDDEPTCCQSGEEPCTDVWEDENGIHTKNDNVPPCDSYKEHVEANEDRIERLLQLYNKPITE